MKFEKTAYRLREAMDDMRISQQELANRSHVSKSCVSHYVLGLNEPGNKSAYQLAKVLNVNPAWLMGLDAPKNKDIPRDISVEDVDKAAELYALYEKAIPEIRAAVDSLLKPKSGV